MNCETATAETLVSRAGVGQCSSPTADPIVSLGRGEDWLAWGFSQPAHNFTDKLPDGSCLVRAALNGVAADFVFIPFFHELTYD